jgi:hypothetical protein
MIRILNRHPKHYLEQGLTQCGAYTVKAVLSAYGKDVKNHPRDYQPHLFGRYLAISTGPYLWPKVLQVYGLSAKEHYATNLSDVEKLALLKNLLDSDNPVMLRIGNGYSKGGKYHPWVANFVGHWISLWGYDDENQIFYVYDSYVARARHDKSLPVGNTTRTFSEVLRDWGKGFPFSWRYSYIKIG